MWMAPGRPTLGPCYDHPPISPTCGFHLWGTGHDHPREGAPGASGAWLQEPGCGPDWAHLSERPLPGPHLLHLSEWRLERITGSRAIPRPTPQGCDPPQGSALPSPQPLTFSAHSCCCTSHALSWVSRSSTGKEPTYCLGVGWVVGGRRGESGPWLLTPVLQIALHARTLLCRVGCGR